MTKGMKEKLAGGEERTGRKATLSRKVFPTAILVRLTDAEKRKIDAAATAAKLSVSRYLVRCGMSPGAAPPTKAERERLEKLAFVFHKTGLGLTRLAAQASIIKAVGASEEMLCEMRETADALSRLARDVIRRLDA